MTKQIECVGCKAMFEFTEKDQQFFKEKGFGDPKRCKPCRIKKKQERQAAEDADPARKNWSYACDNCEGTPTVGDTGLCGPCCWGEAETINGNW